MNTNADVVIYGGDRVAQLVVEIKALRNVSVEWAQQYRRNLIMHTSIPQARLFLMAFPDVFYLWKLDATNPELLEIPPTYIIDATQALALFYGEDFAVSEDTSKFGFNLLVSSWLRALSYIELPQDDSGLDWLFASGLYDVVKNGSSVFEATS